MDNSCYKPVRASGCNLKHYRFKPYSDNVSYRKKRIRYCDVCDKYMPDSQFKQHMWTPKHYQQRMIAGVLHVHFLSYSKSFFLLFLHVYINFFANRFTKK